MARSPELSVQLWFGELGPRSLKSSSPEIYSNNAKNSAPTLRALLRENFLHNKEMDAQLELSAVRPRFGRRTLRVIDAHLEEEQGGNDRDREILFELAKLCDGPVEILEKYEILVSAA